jgi:hypothetical protein
MPLLRISSAGLAAIGFAVAMLWGCIVTENAIVREARKETKTVLQDLRKMRNGSKPIPVSTPLKRVDRGLES